MAAPTEKSNPMPKNNLEGKENQPNAELKNAEDKDNKPNTEDKVILLNTELKNTENKDNQPNKELTELKNTEDNEPPTKEEPKTPKTNEKVENDNYDDEKYTALRNIKRTLSMKNYYEGDDDEEDAYEKAFELTGWGKFSYLVLITSCLIHNYVIIEMFAIAYVITPAECDLNMNVVQLAMCISAVFMGILFSGFLWGRISDVYGRKFVIVPCIYAAIVMSFVSSLATSFWMFFAFRFFTGVFVGAPNAITFVYLGEMQISSVRDIAIVMIVTSGQFTCILLPAIAWIIIPNSWSFYLGSILIRPWRVYMWTWSIMGVIGGALLYYLPESPKFVMIREGPEKALLILKRIYAANFDGFSVDFPVTNIPPRNEHQSNLTKDFLQLVQRPMFKCLVLLNAGIFITYVLAFGLYIWLPDILNEALKEVDGSDSICDIINRRILVATDEFVRGSFIGLSTDGGFSDDCQEGEVNLFVYPTQIVMESLNLIPFILVCIYIHTMNKTKVFAMILLVNGSAITACAFVPQMMTATILLIVGVSGGSAICILSALAVEAFPTSLRGLAVSLMYSCGFLGAIVGANIMAVLYAPVCYIIFTFFAFFALATSSSILYLWPNMRDVRAQMELRHFTY